MNIKTIAKEINEILEKKREELKLSFEEEGHIYYMKGVDGVIRDNYPSVSSVIDEFYTPFDTEEKSLQMCNGNVKKQKVLLESWEASGVYAVNKGSRAHYELEKYSLEKFNVDKEVRKPSFECNEQQIIDSDNMIIAGKSFVDLMVERGCYLIDTEVVLGSNTLKYVGQADNFWLSLNKDKTEVGIIITDWKTNKVKNLEPMHYHTPLYPPFDNWLSYALTHYYLQLPLYGRLFKDMLIGSKYENIKILGAIIVSVRDDSSFVEYRVPKFFLDTLLTMDLKQYIKTKKPKEKYYD